MVRMSKFEKASINLLTQEDQIDEKSLKNFIDKYGTKTKDRDGRILLMSFVLKKQYKSICFLIKNNCDINTQDKNEMYCLHFTAIHGFYELSKLLLQAKCDLEIKDNWGNTPPYGEQYKFSLKRLYTKPQLGCGLRVIIISVFCLEKQPFDGKNRLIIPLLNRPFHHLLSKGLNAWQAKTMRSAKI